MPSPQTLDEPDRRLVAGWAADCAERVLAVFEAEAPDETRARDGVERARRFGRGDLDAASQIRDRLIAGRAAQAAASAAGKAAARAAGQASGVAHMGAHALGAAAYAALAAELAAPGRGGREESAWQLAHMSEPVQAALRRLPLLGEDQSGPLGPGLLASGALGAHIERIQAALAQR
ncbi:putative immunity protein [Microbacterium sp. M1A1_1b]